MENENRAFRDAAKKLETSEGLNLLQQLSEGRHALVLLRHFG